MFSLGIEDERTLPRARFREQVTDRLAATLEGPDAALRAELIAGQLLGLGATLRWRARERRPPGRPDAPGLQRLVDGA